MLSPYCSVMITSYITLQTYINYELQPHIQLYSINYNNRITRFHNIGCLKKGQPLKKLIRHSVQIPCCFEMNAQLISLAVAFFGTLSCNNNYISGFHTCDRRLCVIAKIIFNNIKRGKFWKNQFRTPTWPLCSVMWKPSIWRRGLI